MMKNPAQPRLDDGRFGFVDRVDHGQLDDLSATIAETIVKTPRMARNKVRLGRTDDLMNTQVMAWMASTTKGRKSLATLRSEMEAQRDTETVRWLDTVEKNGLDLENMLKARRAEERKTTEKAKRAASNSCSPLRVSKDVMEGRKPSAAEVCPIIAAEWDHERNVDDEGNPISPEQVTPS